MSEQAIQQHIMIIICLACIWLALIVIALILVAINRVPNDKDLHP